MLSKLTKLFNNVNIFFIIPLVVFVFVGLFIIQPLKEYIKEFINIVLLIIIGYSIVALFSETIFKKALFVTVIVLLHVLLFIKLSFYYTYGAKLNASAFYLIFETNAQESLGFLENYMSKFVVGLGLALFFSLVLFFRTLLKKETKVAVLLASKSSGANVVIYFMLIAICVFSIKLKLASNNIPSASYLAYKEYVELKSLIKEDLSKPESDYLEITESIDSVPDIHVVIIGETISRGHMSLYNYHRETNPRLNKIKNELFLFKDVISPNNQTMKSLDKILTFSDFGNPYRRKNSSIIQIANEANYETYWLSNQKPVGQFESVATQIGHAADYKYFLATDNFWSESFDGVLLEKFKEILLEKNKKKVIFLHIVGGHGPYYKRYPQSFNFFKGLQNEYEFSESKMKQINSYDNAMLYNDYIVKSIIDALKTNKINSSVVFFSDHGEDVYDCNKEKLLEHQEYYFSTCMYEVPFILWFSPEYESRFSRESLKGYLDRKYNLQDFVHSFSDLIGVQHNLFQPNKSILNQEFEESIRYIEKGEDYDKIRPN